MPDQLAHFRFACRVMQAMDPALRARICVSSPAFRCGTFGPDPMFHDPLPAGREKGFSLHRLPGRVALERLRKPLRESMPWAMDFAAGFFCHYALDRLCHPELNALAARGEATHIAVEVAYDRLLLSRSRKDMCKSITLSPSALQTAVTVYRDVTPKRFRMDLRTYWRLRRFLLNERSSHLAKIPGKLRPSWDGLIPYPETSPGVQKGMEMLGARIEASVDIAVEQLHRYFDAIASDLPLDPWCDANFAGNVPEGDGNQTRSEV